MDGSWLRILKMRGLDLDFSVDMVFPLPPALHAPTSNKQQASTSPKFRTFRPTVAPVELPHGNFLPRLLLSVVATSVPSQFFFCLLLPVCLLRSLHRLLMHEDGIRGVRQSLCCRCAPIISYLLVVPTEYLLCAPMRLAGLFYSPSACPPRGPFPSSPPFPDPDPDLGVLVLISGGIASSSLHER